MSPADNVSASSARFTAGRINRRIKRWSSSTRRSPWHRFAPYLGTVLALSLFGGALYLLHRQVAGYDPQDVRKALDALSWQRIIAAFGLMAASYVLLMFYDALALRHIRKTLPFGRVARFTALGKHSPSGQRRPTSPQNPRHLPGVELKVISPWGTTYASRLNTTKTETGAPLCLRQLSQWHHTTDSGRPVATKRTAPHRLLPSN